MGSEHRKIELQSPSDLTYLTTQIRAAARQKLDLHLPPAPDTSSPDDLRRNVEELVEAFVAQVLQGMRNNISINGMDVIARGREGDEVDERGQKIIIGEGEKGTEIVEVEEYEAFDDKLRSKLATEVAKRDALISKLSTHRRNTAAKAAEKWKVQFEAESEALFQVAEGEGVLDAGLVEGLERQSEVERNWERAVQGLERLNKGLPETRARLERAGDVVGYLGGGK
jgi:kinetochor protein Mis14/NSL1